MKRIICLIMMAVFYNSTLHAQCQAPTAKAHLDINNVDALILNGGDMWWDKTLGTANYEIPKGGGVSSQFASALWIGGIDNTGQLHLAARTYLQTGNDYFAGPLDSIGYISAALSNDYDKIWKVNATELQIHNANTLHTLANTPASILEWPAIHNIYAKGKNGASLIITESMAPYVDVDGVTGYNPLGGDYPKICGDQALWYVFNDAGNTHSESGGLPLKIEVQAMAYAYIGSGHENNSTFYSYKIINKSSKTYSNTQFAFWNDADLGFSGDDFMACDTLRNLSIVYNADAYDNPSPVGYLDNIPITGISMIDPPIDINNNTINMNGYYYYNNSVPANTADPVVDTQYYNYMIGKWKDGTPFTLGLNGYGGSQATNYMFPSAPNDVAGWSMCQPTVAPQDIRTIQAFGAFTFHPNQELNFTLATTTVFGNTYPCPSFDTIQSAVDYIKNFYNQNTCNSTSSNGTPHVEGDQNVNVNVYPNPAKNYLVIENGKKETNTVLLFDVLGRKQLEKEMAQTIKNENKFQIDISKLMPGIYFAKTIDIKGKPITTRFVKQ